MKVSDEKQQDQSSALQVDLIGWAGYAVGLITALLGLEAPGAIIGGLSLGLVISFYLKAPVDDCLSLDYRKQERLNRALLMAFFVLLITRFAGIAFLCLGANFFLWGCLSLKLGKIYLGKEWRLEARTCYTRSGHSGRYWLWTVLFLFLGIIFLVRPLWVNMWFIYKHDG